MGKKIPMLMGMVLSFGSKEKSLELYESQGGIQTVISRTAPRAHGAASSFRLLFISTKRPMESMMNESTGLSFVASFGSYEQ
jgi:hypothetical protein